MAGECLAQAHRTLPRTLRLETRPPQWHQTPVTSLTNGFLPLEAVSKSISWGCGEDSLRWYIKIRDSWSRGDSSAFGVSQIPRQMQLMGERFFSLRFQVQSILVGRSRLQELE